MTISQQSMEIKQWNRYILNFEHFKTNYIIRLSEVAKKIR